MIYMNTLYDTGYNLTNLVELLEIERKISAQPSFFGSCLYEMHHTVGKQNLVHPI